VKTRDHAFAVADALKAQIPGLWARVDYDLERSAFMLLGRYPCPCGEISALRQVFYEDVDYPPVEFTVERLKWALREHVREEGNEPNF
jgi:hypothetical protein